MPDVIVNEIPGGFTAFKPIWDQLSSSPEGAAAGIVLALCVMVVDKKEGAQCVQLADPALPSSRLRFVEERLAGKDYLPNSYFLATSPANGYQLGVGQNALRFSTNPYSGDPAEGRVKFFVECSGADSARPVSVARNSEGRWTAVEWSSLLVGVRPPVQP